jgi:hypothetical protein
MQLFDAPLHCIQAPIYPVQNFEHNTEVPMTNFLGIKHVNKTTHQSGRVQLEHEHACNYNSGYTSIS